jgi:hypothetical protein
MRRFVLAIAAAGALAGAAALTAPAVAAPVNLGALNGAAATLDNFEPAALVCGRWRCWHVRRHHRHHRYWHRWHYY